MQGDDHPHRAGLGRRSLPLRYGMAIGCAAAGLVISLQTVPVLHSSTVFLAAVVIASWFGGPGPGLLTAVLATWAVEFFFTQPLHSFTPTLHQIPRLAVFAVLAVLGGWASAARRRAEDSLQQARDELEIRVQERTAELQRSNRRLQSEIAERRLVEKAVEQLAGRLIHAQEQERSRIGRELHDHISQMLGVLTIRIDQLRSASAPTASTLDQALAGLRLNITELTEDVHRLSHRLHSSTLDYLGLVPALQKLTVEFSDSHDIPVAFDHQTLPSALPSEVALCLFRVAEESLTNIAKHSGARSAEIRLYGDAGGLHLFIEDSGNGFDATRLEAKPGLGFVSMQERLRVIRGTIRVDSAPSRGTRIEVWVPSASLQLADPTEDAAGSASQAAVARDASAR
jgi:signal transduction histidine kinase